METPVLAQLLAPYRALESEDQLAAIVDAPDMIRACAAWRTVRAEWLAPGKRIPSELTSRWLWIWRGGRFDLEAYSASLAMPQIQAELRLSVLVASRVIYPDGSVTQHAQQLIEAHVKQRYPRRRPGRPKGAPNKTPPEIA